MLQQLQFSQCSLSQNLLAKHVRDLFYRYALARGVVLRGAIHPDLSVSGSTAYTHVRSAIPDDAISALSEFLGHIVPLQIPEISVSFSFIRTWVE